MIVIIIMVSWKTVKRTHTVRMCEATCTTLDYDWRHYLSHKTQTHRVLRIKNEIIRYSWIRYNIK